MEVGDTVPKDTLPKLPKEPTNSNVNNVKDDVIRLSQGNLNLSAEWKNSEKEMLEIQHELEVKGDEILKLSLEIVELLEKTLSEEEEGSGLLKEFQGTRKKLLLEEFEKLRSGFNEYKKICDAAVSWTEKGRKEYVYCQKVFLIAQQKISMLEGSLVEKQGRLDQNWSRYCNLRREKEMLQERCREAVQTIRTFGVHFSQIRGELHASLEKEQALTEELALAHSRLNSTLSSESELREQNEKNKLEMEAFREKHDNLESELTFLQGKLERAEASERQLKEELRERVAENESLRAKLDTALKKLEMETAETTVQTD